MVGLDSGIVAAVAQYACPTGYTAHGLGVNTFDKARITVGIGGGLLLMFAFFFVTLRGL